MQKRHYHSGLSGLCTILLIVDSSFCCKIALVLSVIQISKQNLHFSCLASVYW